MKSKAVKLAVAGVLGLMLLGSGIVTPLALQNFNKTSDAAMTSYVNVSEIWNSDDKTFNKDNVDILYKYLTGNASASYDNVASLASSKTTASDIKSKTLSAGTGYSAKTSTQDVVVTIGGLDWQVVYLSNDTDGNPTMTLWLTNYVQDAFYNYTSDSSYYYFVDGYLVSYFFNDWKSWYDGVYSNSFVRATTLNNVDKNKDSAFATFTVDEFGLTNYITKPNSLSWQKEQYSEWYNSYTIPSDAVYPSSSYVNWMDNAYEGSSGKYPNAEWYTCWGNDTLWIPSLSETYSNDGLLWNVTSANKSNDSGMYETMLRSKNAIYALDPTIFTYTSSGDFNEGSNASNNQFIVRPAFHLNLKKIKDSFAYYFDLNGRLDNKDTGNISGYATCDIYMDGVKVKSGVTDYYVKHPYGTKYEIKNIQYNTDKAYVGVFKGSLSGTITSNISVSIQIRTKTWEDYASSSYASGSGTQASPYIIKTPQQLAKLCVDSRSSTLSGKYYKLGANIDLSAHIWSGIGKLDSKFAGNIDGNFYTVTGIETAVDYYINDYIGFINNLNGGQLSNIILKNGSIIGTYDIGGAVGVSNSGTIQNVIVDNYNIKVNVNNRGSAGGIIGSVGSATIQNCVSRNNTITTLKSTDTEANIGGIAGWTNTFVLRDCSVKNVTLVSATAKNKIGCVIGSKGSSNINSSYGQVIINGMGTKLMYGDSSEWGNWSYNTTLNGGYPVQKSLFHIGGISGSVNVYNYLKNILGFGVG